ncbi:hypothetical protein BC628DRAFT_1056169 [Trametes gibbosa]|nr:hypothetical protein BC628DRAFT_1056169 [Trametes gibbosa]
MNFFDAYDAPGTTTPPANGQPSLNEEVTQVVGQLSRFWGGFRKQSQTALETARKDLGQVVQQAQKELTKLTAEAPPSTTAAATESSASTAEQDTSSRAHPDAEVASAGSTSTHDPSEDASEPSTSQPQPTSQPQNLFTRLQSSLPPSLVSTVQAQIPESLKETLQHARIGSTSLSAPDFAQLRSTITTELQRVQGVTEEYVHRSEDLLREAGEFLKDAVKVVPPEAGDDGYSGLIWDGTDVWMLPSSSAPPATESVAGSAKGKEREGRSSSSSGRPSVDPLRAVATRAQSMLKQLRHDPEVIKADPNDDEKTRDVYTSWLAADASSEERGIGTTEWQKKIDAALADTIDGAALQATLETLGALFSLANGFGCGPTHTIFGDHAVPAELTPEEFWTRYFFRVYQVESEEARRKAIIQGKNRGQGCLQPETHRAHRFK